MKQIIEKVFTNSVILSGTKNLKLAPSLALLHWRGNSAYPLSRFSDTLSLGGGTRTRHAELDSASEVTSLRKRRGNPLINKTLPNPVLRKEGARPISPLPLGEGRILNELASCKNSGEGAFTLAEVFSPCLKVKFSFGFTLAETLITLGIIGVVAALTIPTLVANYRKHVVETKLKHFYSEINQVFVQAQIDFGDFKNIPSPAASNTEETRLQWAETYLIPYIKYTKIEKCGVLNYTCIYLTDGSILAFGIDNFNLILDESIIKNRTKQHNGKNCFSFILAPDNPMFINHKNKAVEPYCNMTNNSLYTHPVYGCSKAKTLINGCFAAENKCCSRVIQLNGWKIPDNYPIKF